MRCGAGFSAYSRFTIHDSRCSCRCCRWRVGRTVGEVVTAVGRHRAAAHAYVRWRRPHRRRRTPWGIPFGEGGIPFATGGIHFVADRIPGPAEESLPLWRVSLLPWNGSLPCRKGGPLPRKDCLSRLHGSHALLEALPPRRNGFSSFLEGSRMDETGCDLRCRESNWLQSESVPCRGACSWPLQESGPRCEESLGGRAGIASRHNASQFAQELLMAATTGGVSKRQNPMDSRNSDPEARAPSRLLPTHSFAKRSA